MTPNDLMRQRITRASIVKYNRLCNEAKSKIDFDAERAVIEAEILRPKYLDY